MEEPIPFNMNKARGAGADCEPQSCEVSVNPGEKNHGPGTWSNPALIALLLLLVFACYANSLANGFVYDDEQQILQNPYLKSWHYLPQIFGSTVWSFVGAAGLTNYYRPLMSSSYLILWQLFGAIPFGFHLFSVAVNAAVVILVYYVGQALFQDRRVAWVAAALFAVHPVHTEAVTWIAGLPDLEATFFFLLTFWLFSKPGKMDWKRQGFILASFSLALLSKEPALMLAPLAVAFEHFVRHGRETASLPNKIKRYAPLWLLAPGYLLLRIALFGKVAPVLQHPKISWAEALYSAFALIGGYVKYLFWPAPLSAFHAFHQSTTFADGRVLLGVATAVFAIALIVVLYKKSPAAAFCILWIGVTLAPVLNARWMAANVFTERYLFLPSAGFCWLTAWCGLQAWDAHSARSGLLRPLLAVTLAATLLAMAAATVSRNAVWRDDMTLYTRTLETNPDAAVIRSNLGGLYYQVQQYDRAGREWERALAEKPDNVITMNALGMLYTEQNRFADAEEMLLRAIATRPMWGDAHYNYGRLLQKKGDVERARSEFKLAVELAPLDATARRLYGTALLANEELAEAEVQLGQAADLAPSHTTLSDLVKVKLRRGKIVETEAILRRIAREFPYDSEGHFQLARLLEDTGRKEEAAREYEAGLSTDASNAEAKAALRRLGH